MATATTKNQQPPTKTLRWLLRRGSPLPIPNREVKPACADGTAVMWESMSSPFFIEPCLYRQGSFFLMDRRVRPKGLGSSPFFMKLQLEKVGGFLFYTWSPLGFLLLRSNVTFASPIRLKPRVFLKTLFLTKRGFLFYILLEAGMRLWNSYFSPDSS